MTVSLTFGQVLAIGLALIGGFAGMVQLVFSQLSRHLDEKFSTQSNNIGQRLDRLDMHAESWRGVERDLLALRAELPDRYVRREDYIRNQTVIEIKLDGIKDTVQLLQRQMDRRQENQGPPDGIERREDRPGHTG